VIARPAPPAVGRALLVVAAVLLALLAIFLVVVSFASYATVKQRLDEYASDGDAELSPERFEAIVWQLRGLAAVLAALAAGAWVGRGRLARLVETFFGSVAAESRALAAALRRTIAGESRLHLSAFGAILLAAVLVRVEFLFQPMRYDEAGTYVHYASQPLYIGLTTYTAPNNHLLNTFLVHVSTAIFGDEPWAIRLPAFLAGILLVPATYLAGRLLYGRAAALLAAGLVAASSVLVEYSTNARGYTLVALAFALLLALGARLPATPAPPAWAAFAVVGALGLFAIPTFLYALGAAGVWLAVSTALERPDLLRRRFLPAVAGCAALTALLYAPVIAVSGIGSLVGNSFVESRGWSYFAEHLPSSLAGAFEGWHRDQPAPLWIALAAGFALGLLLHRRIGRTRVSPWLGPLLFIPPLVVLQRVVPFERTWLFLLPLYLITAAAGVALFFRRLETSRWESAAVAAVAVAVSASLAGQAVASQAVYHSEDTSTFRDAPEVAAFLAGELRPGDRVLVVPPADLILEYYLNVLRFDAGRLLYSDFSARRYLVVVKPPPDGYSLHEVIAWRLSPENASNLKPVLMLMFSRSQVYELVPEAG
jgi:hypothetical protein